MKKVNRNKKKGLEKEFKKSGEVWIKGGVMKE